MRNLAAIVLAAALFVGVGDVVVTTIDHSFTPSATHMPLPGGGPPPGNWWPNCPAWARHRHLCGWW